MSAHAMHTHSLSHKIIRNTAYNIFGRFWGILITLFLTPYIISRVGIEKFGILAIVGAVTGYFSLMDIGIGSSFVRYIAKFYTKKEYEKISSTINTGVAFYSIFAVIVITLSLFCLRPILTFFNIPLSLYRETFFVFWVSIIVFCISNILSAFAAVQSGLQRMDLSNKVAIAVSVFNVAGTIFFLEGGYGLPGLVVNNAVTVCIIGIINIIISFRLIPGLRLNLFRLDGRIMRRLSNFGYKLQVSKIADLILFQTDRLFIAHFFNISFVGFYQLGSSITQQARQLPLLLTSAILPAASEMDARQEAEGLRELYVRGSKYLILASFPVIFFVMATARLIMWTWMGAGYSLSAVTILILAPGYLVNLVAGIGVMVALAIGKPELQMRAAIITAMVNIVLCLIFIRIIGFAGVALATTIALALGPIYFFITLHKHLKISSRRFIKEAVIVPLAASVLPAIFAYGCNEAVFGHFQLHRVEGLALFIIEGVIFISAYALTTMKSKCLDDYDISLFKKHFNLHKYIDTLKAKDIV